MSAEWQEISVLYTLNWHVHDCDKGTAMWIKLFIVVDVISYHIQPYVYYDILDFLEMWPDVNVCFQQKKTWQMKSIRLKSFLLAIPTEMLT